ncbi:T9SS type A sorting domain-containing protein [Paracrocinitomix mangrovi]|uniref:T9SS type A sorting domain-containing protein n=1 Tax=Paracrocinitomix mangrovi TaxID=2862509 RepID=UPI001C8EA09C|nr:T9SS type A sorting domain-containing protein [Paracrocinitomix mangrovi]UKN00405.1 T9SS type A sorting domain-containing protein [Paracrocinitomix mangrovi]
MKKIYVLLGAVLASGASFSQLNTQYHFSADSKHTPYSITTIENRDAIYQGGDRTTYYTEDFDAMSDLNTTWIAAVQTGGVGFALTSTGHANDAGSSFFIPALLSSTPTQWVVLDSDSDGSSGTDENATLTSPVINASGAGGGPLKLEFEQFFAEWEQGANFDTLYVGVSDDGGATWSEIVIEDGVGREGRPNPQLVSINITPYVTNQANIQVRFRWKGNWAYGWQIDNVSVLDLPDNDLIVQDVFRGDLINSIMYSRIPDEQTVPFVLGADIKNIGFADQTNVGFEWEIFDGSMTSIGSGTTSANIASLSNGQNDTVWVTTTVTPTAIGNYTINFKAIADQTELPADTTNNWEIDQEFHLTDYEYGADYGTPTSAFYNWANNNNGAASVGNVFLVQAGGVVGAMRAELDNNAIVADKIIYYVLYIYNSGTGEYDYLAQTSDYTTTSADEGNFVDLFFTNPVTVNAGDQLLGVAAHYGGTETAGWEMSGRVAQGAVLGTDETQQFVNLIDPSAPAVRLLMQDYTGLEEDMTEDKFSVYPNPANDFINVSISLTESENTTINVLDISGKVIATRNLGNIQGDKNITISMRDFATGVYFVEMINENHREVKKIVKK